MGRLNSLFLLVATAYGLAFFVTGCGRNLCIAGMGPCAMFKDAENDRKKGGGDGGGGRVQCGKKPGTSNPRNGLVLLLTNPDGGSNTKVAVGKSLVVSGAGLGVLNYAIKGPNEAGKLVGGLFTASKAGFVCLKVYDGTMGINSDCDLCEKEVEVTP